MTELAPENIDYVTFDHTFADRLGTARDLTVLASYQLIDGREVVELVEAVNEWGEDWLGELRPHEYEDARRTALSLFHAEGK